jgi:hypothetical protein
MCLADRAIRLGDAVDCHRCWAVLIESFRVPVVKTAEDCPCYPGTLCEDHKIEPVMPEPWHDEEGDQW